MATELIFEKEFARAIVTDIVTADGASSSINPRRFGSVTNTLSVTAISGMGASIQFTLEASDDETNWSVVHETHRFTATGFQRIQRVAIGAGFFRWSWKVLGTTPSVTFKISSTMKDFLPTRTGSLIKYDDLNLATLNAVSTTYSAVGNDTVSVILNRSTDGLGLAVVIVEGSADLANFGVISGNIDVASGATVVKSFTGVAFRFYRIRVASAVLEGSPKASCFWASTGGN